MVTNSIMSSAFTNFYKELASINYLVIVLGILNYDSSL